MVRVRVGANRVEDPSAVGRGVGVGEEAGYSDEA